MMASIASVLGFIYVASEAALSLTRRAPIALYGILPTQVL
jgi:hypothetical protein